jgi:DNA-binding response OmpR family regulator
MRVILLAEDEETLRQIYQELLEKKFDLFLAEDGQEALDLFELHSDRVDLVMLDMRMPFFSGYEVARRIRQTSSVPILFTSSAPEELELEKVSFLNKPFRMADLIRKIEEILA